MHIPDDDSRETISKAFKRTSICNAFALDDLDGYTSTSTDEAPASGQSSTAQQSSADEAPVTLPSPSVLPLPLPAGWTEATAPDGRTYYWSRSADGGTKTQWAPPTQPVSVADRSSAVLADELELQLRRADDMEQRGLVAAASELRAEAMMRTAGEYAGNHQSQAVALQSLEA